MLQSAFQPIFAFVDGKLEVAAFEGLIRPFRDGEAVRPLAFFNHTQPADRLHVETLTRTLHLLNAGAFLDPAAMLFINFDPSVFSERQVAEASLREMRLVLHEAGIDPHRIVCEVTEQRSGSHQALQMFVGALRDHGLKIAVDDYGAQDSDMERVSALKPDIIKFDAQWISRLMDSRPGFALLSVMVEEFVSRGIKTVFEGIEEGWQLELAERSGAHMVQGYVLARPELAPTSFSTFGRPAVAAASLPGNALEQPMQAKVAEAHPPHRTTTRQRTFGRRIAS
jgi:EAL domain-containing protein (putative c-di-GMP-specific phosphodiesterase class I)